MLWVYRFVGAVVLATLVSSILLVSQGYWVVEGKDGLFLAKLSSTKWYAEDDDLDGCQEFVTVYRSVWTGEIRKVEFTMWSPHTDNIYIEEHSVPWDETSFLDRPEGEKRIAEGIAIHARLVGK
jgi:hypothetical protein